jgi:glycosyltransferase involved in cell wall biosynthesis
MAERTFHMSRFLSMAGAPCTVLTLNIGLDAARVAALAPATIVALPYLWRRFYVPRISWRHVRHLVDDADIIHLMGHWGILNAVFYLAARRAGKPYVVCPAGALPLFGRSRWLKRLYNLVIGNAIVRNADATIAVTAAEIQNFQSYGVPASDVTVIPNGVCKEDFAVFDKASLLARGVQDAPMILFMGRLNPIKGPDLLLQAFAQVRDRLPGYQLVFAGPDGGMLSLLQAAAARHGLAQRVHFLGHVDGGVKSTAYRFAKLLVVPSRQEAMSIVALEAGICGTPVLLTDQCGFSEIRTVDPRLEVPATADALADGLVQLLSDPFQLAKIGTPWQHLVESRYAWEAIVPVYLELYKDVLNRGGPG